MNVNDEHYIYTPYKFLLMLVNKNTVVIACSC